MILKSSIIFLIIILFQACGVVGNNEGEQPKQATLSFTVEASNFLDVNVTNSNQKIQKSFYKSTIGTFPDYNSSSIASGAPDDLKLYVKSIKLSNSGDSQFDETIFQNNEGKGIYIHSGKVDISNLFEAEVVPAECTLIDGERSTYDNQNVIASNNNNGTITLNVYEENGGVITLGAVVKTTTCPNTNNAKVAVSAGSYSILKIEFLRRAKIKGCVTGNFTDVGTKAGIAGTHTYCTQTGKSTFDNDDTQNSDFETNTSTLMDVDLKITSEGRTTDRTESFTIDYPIEGNITLTAGNTSELTMLFDLNRFLRYFNNGRTDNQAPNPSAPNTFTYFYTLDLERDNAAYAFVGKAGSIYGYRTVLEGCSDLPMPQDRVCVNISNTVGLWMTSIYDKNNAHIKTTFMPDDDNAFTTIKGSTDNIENPIVELGGGRVNIKYGLDENTQGTIFNFKHATSIDEKVDGVTFEGFQDTYGQLYMQRKL